MYLEAALCYVTVNSFFILVTQYYPCFIRFFDKSRQPINDFIEIHAVFMRLICIFSVFLRNMRHKEAEYAHIFCSENNCSLQAVLEFVKMRPEVVKYLLFAEWRPYR